MDSTQDLQNLPVPADVLFGALSGADWLEESLGEKAQLVARDILRRLEVVPVFACAAHKGRIDQNYYLDTKGVTRVVSLRPVDVAGAVAEVFAQEAPDYKDVACQTVYRAAGDYLTPERRVCAAGMVSIGHPASPAP